MKFDRSKFTKKFVTEAREHVDFLARSIVELEAKPDELSSMAEIKRAAHTLKGSARMLKYTSISKVAHKLEDIFIAIMEEKVSVGPGMADVLLLLVDYIKLAIEAIATGEDEPEITNAIDEAAEQALSGNFVLKVRGPDPEQLPKKSESTGADQSDGSDSRGSGSGSGSGSDSSKDGTKAKSKAKEKTKERSQSKGESLVDDTLRVSVPSLDLVLDSIGEARLDQRVLDALTVEATRRGRRILGTIATDKHEHSTFLRNQVEDLVKLLQRLEEQQYHVGADIRLLFEQAESLRMVPLQDLFDRFLVPIRETARTRGKRVRLTFSGGELGLDKQIVDQLYGPMLHLLNNAVDHGIERADERESAGKSPTGNLKVEVHGLAGAVEIIVQDDGKGVDTAKLVERAIERSIITEKSAASMSSHERLQLVFHSGLSAAEIITDLSGRGVGMDVVKTVIEGELKGSVMLASEAGVGTTTVLRLPLSLSSSRLFLLLVSGRTYALPLSSVVTSLMTTADDFIDVAGRKAIRFENQFIPVADASQLLGTDARQDSAKRILIIASGAERLAIIVDEILDEQEMLVKPLPTLFEGLRDVSGITFGSMGEPIPVLYVPDLIDTARNRSLVEDAIQSPSVGSQGPYHILIVDDSYNTREVQQHILETHGYRVSMASDGVEALERLVVEDIDLVVTDIEMPRMDGFTLVERIRAQEETRRLPVIILTSRETEGDRARGVDVGANAYIVKRTFDEQKLTATLETLLP